MSENYKKITKSFSSDDLTPEKIYDIINDKNKGGIQGYLCPRKYYDYHQVMWLKKREQILKQHKAAWPPDDWKKNKETGNKEAPKKLNFIDERIMWAKSFNDPKKSQEIRDALEAKGKPIPEFNPFKSDFDKKPNKKNLLSSFKEQEEKLKKMDENHSKEMEELKKEIEYNKEQIEKKAQQDKLNHEMKMTQMNKDHMIKMISMDQEHENNMNLLKIEHQNRLNGNNQNDNQENNSTNNNINYNDQDNLNNQNNSNDNHNYIVNSNNIINQNNESYQTSAVC